MQGPARSAHVTLSSSLQAHELGVFPHLQMGKLRLQELASHCWQFLRRFELWSLWAQRPAFSTQTLSQTLKDPTVTHCSPPASGSSKTALTSASWTLAQENRVRRDHERTLNRSKQKERFLGNAISKTSDNQKNDKMSTGEHQINDTENKAKKIFKHGSERQEKTKHCYY